MEFSFADEASFNAEEQFDHPNSAYNPIRATIFALDMHTLDFYNSKGSENILMQVIDAYLDLMMKRALTYPKDMYGLIMYNKVE